jgi:uncharacterized protein YgbK (DUF1537 family)
VPDALAGTPRVVVLDDDPTGTQTVRDVPVLTRWGVDDVDWALAQDTPGFFVLTNTRSLAPGDAAARTREVVERCLAAAASRGVEVVVASRSDSTLRGHFPLETDVITEVLTAHGRRVDGVVLAPAFPEAGRVTVAGVHYLRDGTGDAALTLVAESEFAADPTFGYRSSRLADWVAEKSHGTIPADDVAELRLEVLRGDDPRLPPGRVVVIDALVDEDLRAAVRAILRAERDGARYVYRVGPSFVRARLGQSAHPPLLPAELAAVTGRGHGLVVVGSHVGRTGRQLARITRPITHVEVDVPAVLDASRVDAHVAECVDAVADALTSGTVVLATSRTLVTGDDEDASLDIARRVSAALVGVTGRAVERHRPAYVLAKGGITSSDVATEALRADRVRVRGSLLPGLVSLWQPVTGPAADLPLVVFPGNVGDDDALADVVDRMEEAACGS